MITAAGVNLEWQISRNNIENLLLSCQNVVPYGGMLLMYVLMHYCPLPY